MDWFSWLSKTKLDSSVVQEYSLWFSENELEEDDVAHFTHEFLLSMGISVAKHRLEIIKLSRAKTSLRPVKRLLKAIKNRIRRLLLVGASQPSDWEAGNSALVLAVQRQRLIPDRDRELVAAKQGRLMMLTNGSPMVVSSRHSRVNSFSASPLVYNHKTIQLQNHQHIYQDQDIRWDTLFQDLKPT